jgi:hypothetical protein
VEKKWLELSFGQDCTVDADKLEVEKFCIVDEILYEMAAIFSKFSPPLYPW